MTAGGAFFSTGGFDVAGSVAAGVADAVLAGGVGVAPLVEGGVVEDGGVVVAAVLGDPAAGVAVAPPVVGAVGAGACEDIRNQTTPAIAMAPTPAGTSHLRCAG